MQVLGAVPQPWPGWLVAGGDGEFVHGWESQLFFNLFIFIYYYYIFFRGAELGGIEVLPV